MGVLSFPFDFSSGTSIRADQMNANFTAAETWSTTLADDNFSSSAGMYSAYRTIHETAGSLVAAGTTAGDFLLASGSALLRETTDTTGAIPVFYLDDARYAISGRSLKLCVDAQAIVNGTGPATTLTVGLFPVSSVAGAAGNLQATLGTVTSGSTVAFASPLANTPNQGSSTDFAFPADGYYTLGVTLAGTTAANSRVGINAQLQVRWT
jgi:hypothetical protein